MKRITKLKQNLCVSVRMKKKKVRNIFAQMNKESVLLERDKRKYITSLQDAES